MLARHRFPCPDLTDKRRITDFSLVISANHRPVRLLIGLAVQSNKESEGNPILLETVEAEPLVVVPPSSRPWQWGGSLYSRQTVQTVQTVVHSQSDPLSCTGLGHQGGCLPGISPVNSPASSRQSEQIISDIEAKSPKAAQLFQKIKFSLAFLNKKVSAPYPYPPSSVNIVSHDFQNNNRNM